MIKMKITNEITNCIYNQLSPIYEGILIDCNSLKLGGPIIFEFF